jgi:DNA polymerase
MEPWSREWKEEELRLLAERWKDCDACPLFEGREHVVFGQGNPDARILFVGEAPGEDEDKTGTAFIGESGNLLKALVTKAGLDWDDLFITNIVA